MPMIVAGLFVGLFAMFAVPVWATCSCQCVDGVARTACTTVDEARANPNACGTGMQRVACETVAPPGAPPLRYPAPAGASDCRSARLWDPRSNGYTVAAKVCDLDPDAAASRP